MTRDDLLTALQKRPVPFTIPGGPAVHLKPLTAAERIAFLAWRRDNPGLSHGLYERLFLAGVVDADGNRLFGEADAAAVGALDGAAVEAVATRVAELSGLTGADPGKA